MELFQSRQKKLAEKVVSALQQHQFELATMESCTGGGLAHALTSVKGAGWVYQGGIVTYSSFAKLHAGVSSDILHNPNGPYTPEVAREMARVSLNSPFEPLPQNGNVIGVGITGILETSDKFYPHIPQGTVWVGIYHDHATEVYQLQLPKRGRQRMKNRLINETLRLVDQTITRPERRSHCRAVVQQLHM